MGAEGGVGAGAGLKGQLLKNKFVAQSETQQREHEAAKKSLKRLKIHGLPTVPTVRTVPAVQVEPARFPKPVFPCTFPSISSSAFLYFLGECISSESAYIECPDKE